MVCQCSTQGVQDNTGRCVIKHIYFLECNCRKKDKCPLQKKCLTQAIVYQAEVKSYDNGATKWYTGVTAGKFKDRYRNHKKSFEQQRCANKTYFNFF